MNSASCWFILYGHVTMHRQQNIKNAKINSEGIKKNNFE